jgi:PHP family Zn ribbon phosphoesterase
MNSNNAHFLADLHVHSTFSDGKMTVPEIVDFYGVRGFGCIAITDHICENQSFLGRAASYLNRTLTKETFPLYLRTVEREAQRAWRQYKMVVIPGFEITKNSWLNHRSAHVLGIGIKEFVEADGDIADLARAIRRQGALAVAAHPVSTGKFEPQTYHLWSRRNELEKEFDAWEVASGTKLFEAVQSSGLPVIATSDLHHPKQIDAWKTVFFCERDREAILQAVRDQEIEIVFYSDRKFFAHEKIASNIGSVSRPVNVFC